MNNFQSSLNEPLIKRIAQYFPTDLPVYLVGGAIRDALLNRQNFDLDLTTAGDAIAIARKVADELGAAYFPLDIQRKVARVIIKAGSLDNPDHEATKIDFSTFQGEDLLNDLQGRDFTINAMAVEIHEMEKLIDPLGGAADLLSKRLRTCSPQSLLDDPVRIFRAIRFSVNLGLTIPSETRIQIRQATVKIPTISVERFRDELFRILLQPHPSTALRVLDRLNALEYFLPEICILKGVKQSPPHVMDVWDHTMEVLIRLESILEVLGSDFDVDKTGNLTIGLVALQLGRYRQQIKQHLFNSLNPDRPHRGLLFLAGLFHDGGKVETQTLDEERKIRFIEHERAGSEVVRERGRALRLSNVEIDRLATIVRHHMRPSLLSHEKGIPSKKAIYRFLRDTGSACVDVCLISLADILATYGATLPQERWSSQLDVVKALLSAWWDDQAGGIFSPPIVTGDDLIHELDLSPGPLIGYLLETIREAQVASEIHNREEAIGLARRLLNSE